MEELFIGIAGIIGAGKSTLATSLGEEFGLPVYYEDIANNEYIEDFYADMKKHSFALQVYLLNKRFKQHQQIIWQGKGGVQDRTIYEDAVFAELLKDTGLMELRDFGTYVELFENMANFMKRPNLIVYLKVSPETSMERIRKRGRPMEKTITIEYLQGLSEAYDRFIDAISKTIPVIRVDWDEFKTARSVAVAIKREYESMRSIRSVAW